MTLALSKTLDPADFDQLTEELAVVDRHFASARAQHPLRRWEYAMALRALAVWWPMCPYKLRSDGGDEIGPSAFDIGGGGSPFCNMPAEAGYHFYDGVVPVDPAVEPEWGWRMSLADVVGRGTYFTADAVFCLSVLEHVDDLDQFLYHLSCLVAPGGLLFLTMDYCDNRDECWPEDRYHFHWMRERIVNQYAVKEMAERLLDFQFSWLGERDLTYHGDHVYDYTFCSLAMVKRP